MSDYDLITPHFSGADTDLSAPTMLWFCFVLMYRLCLFRLQLPHMPHISECLMKRSLKPTDLRDMTLGQLQVIVNDLHSQIESEFAAHMQKPLTSIF